MRGDSDPLVIATRSVFDRTRPTFQHFFTDIYAHPQVWLARRTAYTRSVAASSMVAYIAGIGDRHTSNQLIDVDSGEVVMIDFGLAFEQARLLPTPEQVQYSSFAFVICLPCEFKFVSPLMRPLLCRCFFASPAMW